MHTTILVPSTYPPHKCVTLSLCNATYSSVQCREPEKVRKRFQLKKTTGLSTSRSYFPMGITIIPMSLSAYYSMGYRTVNDFVWAVGMENWVFSMWNCNSNTVLNLPTNQVHICILYNIYPYLHDIDTNPQ